MRAVILLIVASAVCISGCEQPYSTYCLKMESMGITPLQQSEKRPKVPASLDLSTESLNLQQAIEIALANNPEVAATGWDWAGKKKLWFDAKRNRSTSSLGRKHCNAKTSFREIHRTIQTTF